MFGVHIPCLHLIGEEEDCIIFSVTEDRVQR